LKWLLIYEAIPAHAGILILINHLFSNRYLQKAYNTFTCPGLAEEERQSPTQKILHGAMQAFADMPIMETNDFKNAIGQLEEIAIAQRTAYMCSEALWWRCHRSLVSDYLKLRGWTVTHIIGKNKGDEHTYTKPAKIEEGVLKYD